MSLALPILRPYRALVLGVMTLGATFGLITGLAAFAGVRQAIRTNDQVQVGVAGLVAGLISGLALGAVCSVIAVLGLWIGQQFERRGHRREGRAAEAGDRSAAI